MQTSAMKACFQIAECSLSSAKILIFFYIMAFSLAFSPFSRKKVKIWRVLCHDRRVFADIVG